MALGEWPVFGEQIGILTASTRPFPNLATVPPLRTVARPASGKPDRQSFLKSLSSSSCNSTLMRPGQA